MLIYAATLLVGFLVGLIVQYINRARHSKRTILSVRRNPDINAQIERILRPFKFDAEKLVRLKLIIEEQLSLGLGASTHVSADVKMFPTYVRHLPTGNEQGDVLALDLGGTNFRVLRVTLRGNGERPLVDNRVYVVPLSVMKGPGEELFDHLADSLRRFIESEGLLEMDLPLGFTFSFPCIQYGLAKAKLTQWTKGFNCPDVVNEDVVAMLQRAINKKGLKVTVKALTNDTVGTLVACAYNEPKASIGLIVGTGFNACYVEQLSEVGTWDGDFDEPSKVVINTEWGALGANGCLDWMLTSFDKEVDDSSLNQGRQIFEKLVSGMYMGEIVRNILAKLMEKRLLFMNSVENYKIYAAPMMTQGAFLAKYVSDIETDDGINFEKTAMVMQTIGFPDVTYEDCAVIQHVCRIVSKRAGSLVAAGLACLIERIVATHGNSATHHVVVGVDGSLYRYHPRFHRNINKPLKSLLSNNVKYELRLSDDGSGIGSALIAHIDSIHRKSEK